MRPQRLEGQGVLPKGKQRELLYVTVRSRAVPARDHYICFPPLTKSKKHKGSGLAQASFRQHFFFLTEHNVANPMKWSKSLSHALLFATPWTAASQAPPSMGFSRQEYWSGLPFPSRSHPHRESEKSPKGTVYSGLLHLCFSRLAREVKKRPLKNLLQWIVLGVFTQLY